MKATLEQALRIGQIVTSLIAILALIAAINGINTANANRRESARDSCKLLLGLVERATPPKQQAAAKAYIARTPLHNCSAYARTIIR